MNQRVQVLKLAQKLLQDGSQVYICLALSDVGLDDELEKTSVALEREMMQAIFPLNTLGQYVELYGTYPKYGFPSYGRVSRLEYIQRWIEDEEVK